MKPGTFVKLPDGRIGTVVYHGLDGYGIMWGKHKVPVDAILDCCPLFDGGTPVEVLAFQPQAMLRDEYPGTRLECVGDKYEVIYAEMLEEL